MITVDSLGRKHRYLPKSCYGASDQRDMPHSDFIWNLKINENISLSKTIVRKEIV
jgi:hypothetical protein